MRSNRLRNDEFKFNTWHHDKGTETIFDKRGQFDGDDVVDILMEHPATAQFVVQKFWKNYISDFNSDPQQLEVMADVFRASDYEIKTLLRETLSASQFGPLRIGPHTSNPRLIFWLGQFGRLVCCLTGGPPFPIGLSNRAKIYLTPQMLPDGPEGRIV